MSSSDGTNALILWLLFSINAKSIGLFSHQLLVFHLIIKSFSFLKDLHQFSINLITIQLFQNVFLMFKLILRLFGLFSSLLLLNHSIGILRLVVLCSNLLAMGLSTLFVLRLLLLLLSVSGSTRLLGLDVRCLSLTAFDVLVVLTTNTQRLLVVILIYDMHTLALIWKAINSCISAVLLVLVALIKVLTQQSDSPALLLLLIGFRLSL